MAVTDAPPARRPPYLALGLVALSVLMLQVSLTRVFSLLIWYHFAFLAISLALLGFTAGGVIVRLFPAIRGGDASGRMARLALGFSVYSVVDLFVACQLPFADSITSDAKHLASFVVLVLVVLVPFVLAGVIVAATLSGWAKHAGGLYFSDLLGSGVGSLASVVALDRLGGGAGGVLCAAVFGAVAGLVFAREAEAAQRKKLYVAGGVVLAAALAALVAAQRPLADPFYVPNAKSFPRIAREEIQERRCTSVACVDFFENPNHYGIWGLPKRYTESGQPLPEQIGIVIDSWALTSIYRGDPSSPNLAHPIFEAHPPGIVHRVQRELGRTTNEMLIIGAGGGVDIRTAVHFGVRRVEAVDINPSIVDAVGGTYDAFAGGVYHRPDVDVRIAEGRHHLRSSPRTFDLIQLSGVDTLAASQAGAFALSENYLYTVEALKEYLAHLNEDGTLTLTRWLYEPERQTIRLAVIVDRALRELGLGDAAKNMAIVAVREEAKKTGFSVVLVRKKPFAPEELVAVRKVAEADAWEVLYSPDGRAGPNVFTDFFAAADKQAFVDAYPFRIDATTDDSPFFFEHNRVSGLLAGRDNIFGAVSAQLVLVTTLLVVLASMVPLVVVSRWRSRKTPDALVPMSAPWRAYFVALGVGYIAIETVLVSRFVLYLGHPVHALSVIVCVLLASSGMGSAMSGRLVGTSPRRLAAWLAVVAGLLVVYQATFARVFDATLGTSLAARVGVTALLIGALGFAMGLAFPSGLARAPEDERRAGWVAHAWVINGYSSVVGTVAAMFVAITAGFSVVLLLAAISYGVAAIVAHRSPPPTPET